MLAVFIAAGMCSNELRDVLSFGWHMPLLLNIVHSCACRHVPVASSGLLDCSGLVGCYTALMMDCRLVQLRLSVGCVWSTQRHIMGLPGPLPCLGLASAGLQVAARLADTTLPAAPASGPAVLVCVWQPLGCHRPAATGPPPTAKAQTIGVLSELHLVQPLRFGFVCWSRVLSKQH